MSFQERDKCDFCHEIKIVNRTYFKPKSYQKPKDPEDYCKLYNQGDYFAIFRYCNDCGEPVNQSNYHSQRNDGTLVGLYDKLFRELEHGDTDHRNWLYNKFLELQENG